MVAEAHSHMRVDIDDLIALVTSHIDADKPADLTLAACGYEGDLGLIALIDLLGEEYGERTLTPVSFEDLHDQMSVGELVELLCP